MIGILFTARLGSHRLPKKHLIEANNKSFIEWLVLRFTEEFKEEIEKKEVKLIIATSDEPDNKLFEEVLFNYNADVFYGAVANIPRRHLECADHYQLTHIISIDGDDILCSTKGAKTVYNNFKKHPQKDIISVFGLPIGMNSSGYKVSYLRKCLSIDNQDKIETGWGRIFIDPDKMDIKIGDYDIYDKLRFTLDYTDDANFFYTVINFLDDQVLKISDEELIKVVQTNKFDEINSHLFDIYWSNFNTLKQDEQNNG